MAKTRKRGGAARARGFKGAPPRQERFDEQGRRLGDDGLPMTRCRTRMHRLLNGFFLWGVVVALLCVGLTVLAAFQGQIVSNWELVASGGRQLNGYSAASLMRYEALFCLAVAVACVACNLYWFTWLYDGYTARPARRLAAGLGLGCALWCVLAVLSVGVVEPVSLATLLLLAALRSTVSKVVDERAARAVAAAE